jgi:DHA2 family multidrug resistance protein
MATTVLAQRAQPSSPQYQQAASHFAFQGASQADAQQQAIGWLGQLVQDQSSLLSYIDVFWAFAVIAALLVPLALLLLRAVGERRAVQVSQ